MAQPARKILVEFFYDTVSPYSSIAFQAINRCNKSWDNMDLKLKPVFLPGVMQETNNRPPAMVPARGQYMVKDVIQLAKFYNIPFRWPSDVVNVMMKNGTMSAQRLLTAVSLHTPQHLESLSQQIYLRIFFRDQDVTSVESLKEACQAAGLSQAEIDNLLPMINLPEVKEQLRKVTQEALDYGAFGMPTYVAHLKDGPKMMFGSDRLFLLAHYLGQSWPGPVCNAKL